ncbi:MAG TPA: DUF2267 domain-containing protein [Anaeromyxobacteraceae bacterium]|nr:DUF2267 domain-containing protein [Anaeromyxobacteraceae bacterium]
MPMPFAYESASEDFERFLAAAIESSGLTTRNQAYTMTQGVLQVFRRRLAVRDATRFANVLPPVLRAIFVADWDTDEPIRPFQSREVMTREAQSLRREHNFAPDTAIRDVALALRRVADLEALERVIATLPPAAADFWRA